jgi:hypothetical protein
MLLLSRVVEGPELAHFALAGKVCSTWLAEPGRRRHSGLTSSVRWAGVSRSALRSLLHLTAGASQPIR